MPGEKIDLETVDTDSELAKQQIYEELAAAEERRRIDDETEQIIELTFRNSPFLKEIYDKKNENEKSIMRSTMALSICNTIIYYNVR